MEIREKFVGVIGKDGWKEFDELAKKTKPNDYYLQFVSEMAQGIE